MCSEHQLTDLMIWRPVSGMQISAIPADMLRRTWQELEYRLDVLRATKGAHIEVYWGQ
jgi:hypothetical protein